MTGFQINDFELEVVHAAIVGTTTDFRDRMDSSGKAVRVVIHGHVLRCLLLGLPLPTKANDASAPTTCHPVVSIRMRGARIEGPLDVSNSFRYDGNACPPLLLEDCVLTGNGGYDDPAGRAEPALNAKHARLSRLWLKDCQAGFIDLTNAELLSDLELQGLHALTNQGQCRVEAARVRVHGSVKAPFSQLRLKPARMVSLAAPRDYALNLAGAEIAGSIELRPQFTADGGINIAGAHVHGDFWADGAHLTAQGNHALRGQFACIDGVVALTSLHTQSPEADDEERESGSSGSERFIADGSIWLLGAKVGTLQMSGALLRNKTGDGEYCLNCSYTEIAQNVHLAQRNAFSFETDHGVEFYGARIVGSLIASGAKFRAHPGRIGFSGKNLEVGNDLLLNRVEANGITLEGARIARKLDLQRTQLSSFDAQDVHVGGSVYWSGEIREKGGFRGACVEGELVLGASKQFPLKLIQTSDASIALSFEDAKVARDLKILGIQVVFTRLPDWAKSPPLGMRTTKLACYEGWSLGEALYVQKTDGVSDSVAISFLLSMSGQEFLLLDGKAAPVYAFNKSDSLRLETEEQAADYLRFFCAHVWADEGAFRIVESKAELASLSSAARALYPEIAPISIEREPSEESWSAEAFIVYGGKLFSAAFRIRPDGTVEMIDDEQLADPQEASTVNYAAPVRIGKGTRQGIVANDEASSGFSDKWSGIPPAIGLPDRWTPLPDEHPDSLAQHVARLIVAHSRLRTQESGKKPLINLRGLSAGALDDNHGMRWGRDVLLDLEGFEYERFEATGTSATTEFDRAHVQAEQKKTRNARVIREFLHRRILRRGARVPAHADSALTPVWMHRCEWLNQQYSETPPKLEDYKPQPYEQVAKILRKQGDYDNAARILIEKLDLKEQLPTRG